jgi:type IV pilus assembly protein PilV
LKLFQKLSFFKKLSFLKQIFIRRLTTMYKLLKSYAGYSLVEILVAVLVISVGLLGVATLQTRGQQFNHFSYLRTQATFLAYDLMDRMRTNATEARRGTYADNNGNCGSQPTPDTECDSSECSPDRLAQYDMANWRYMVCDVLPWTEKPPREVDDACDNDPDYLGDFEKQYKIVWNAPDNEYKIFIQWIEQTSTT